MAGTGQPSLAELLRDRGNEILVRWEAQARAHTPGAPLGRAAIRDHLPGVLARIAVAASGGELPSKRGTPEPEQHAIDRLLRGYRLGDVVAEYALLRDVVLDVAAEHGVGDVDQIRSVNRIIDEAIEVATTRYAAASQRVLAAVDRLSLEALGSESLDELLRRLLAVIDATSAAVDTATILLVEGGRLRTRAAVGLSAEREAGFSLAIGEGFAGKVAATRKPAFLRDAANDPLVRSQFLRERKVRALYGVPLLNGEELIGVANMGSITAFDFAEDDLLLFRAIAQRAAALITEARLREQLAEETRLLNAVLEQVPVGVVIADRDGRIQLSNRAAERIWRAPMSGSTIEDYRPGQLADTRGRPFTPNELPLAIALRQQRENTSEVIITRGDGTRGRTLSSAAPVRDDAGGVIGAVVAFLDITELKEVEERLHREAEFRERFLGVLGHDLRNPLSVIFAGTHGLLARADLPESVAGTIRRVAGSAARMQRMINDLLDFIRARSGGAMPVKNVAANMRDVLEQVISEAQLTHSGRQITLRGRGELDGRWDVDRLLQLFSNLLANALRYGATDAPVQIEATGTGSEVVVTVTNQGPAIAPEQRATIFEPFKRGSASNPTGLGLGLFIVRAIADAHGGSVELFTTDGQTTFAVRLPREPSSRA